MLVAVLPCFPGLITQASIVEGSLQLVVLPHKLEKVSCKGLDGFWLLTFSLCLVFYANIVGINCTLFLPAKSTDALSVFTAWLNLDFAIEICFYVGMDAFSKTWLQFVFPVYLWLLVGLTILISHFFYKNLQIC